MRSHLVMHTDKVSNYRIPMLKLGGWQYWSKRLQVWKWHKKRTGGRPVLILWRKEPSK